MRPGAAEPGLHLVGDHQDSLAVADPAQPLDELRAVRARSRPHRAAARRRSPRPGTARRATRTCRSRPARACGRGRPAVVVRERRAVDLRRERAHPRLVRVHLGRHRHREHRPAVEAGVERDHGGTAGRDARDLDGVLDRLGAGVEERRPRRAGERDDPAEPLCELDVRRVGHDREIGVDEPGRLLLDRLDDAGMAVAHVADADAACEVDERVAVDIRDRRVQSLGREDRQVDLQAASRWSSRRARGAPASGARGSRCGARLPSSWPRRERTGARGGYSRTVDLDDLDLDPHVQFEHWFAEAAEAGVRYPEQMALATAGARRGARRCGWCCSRAMTSGGSSSTRTARAARRRSSSCESPGCGGAALGARRTARCASRARSRRSRDDESLAYFRTPPAREPDRRLGVAAVPARREQGRARGSRSPRSNAASPARTSIPLPPFWGGYRIVATAIEFWQGQPNRLHDRVRYELGRRSLVPRATRAVGPGCYPSSLVLAGARAAFV